jgi:hypothetical protein
VVQYPANGPVASGSAAGQSLVETTIALTIVLLVVFALIHLSMLAVTRHVANFAAFSAARASVYTGAGDRGRAEDSARSILRILPRGTEFLRLQPDAGGRGTLRVEVLSPFSYPLFSGGAHGKVRVAAEAPLYVQPTIAETGDNASR